MGILWIKGKDKVKRAYGRFQYEKQRATAMLREYNGEDKREPRTEKEAQAAFEAFKAAVRSGVAFMPENPDKKMSVQQFVQYYRDNYWNLTERSGHDVSAILNVVARYFGAKPLAVFNNLQTFVSFARYLRTEPLKVKRKVPEGTSRRKHSGATEWVSLGRTRSTRTIYGYGQRLCHMTAFAKVYDLLDQDPLADEKIRKIFGSESKSAGRQRGVTEAEEAALLKYATPGLADRIRVAIALGPRLSEMVNAQLRDIDFDEWTWRFPGRKTIQGKDVHNTKNGKDRVIPIPPELRPFFENKRRIFTKKVVSIKPDETETGAEFLFGDADGNYVHDHDRVFARAKFGAKLDDARLLKQGKMPLHWHDLRGEAGTRMLNRGVAPALVAEILGNTVAVLMKHYKGDLLKGMRDAVTK